MDLDLEFPLKTYTMKFSIQVILICLLFFNCQKNKNKDGEKNLLTIETFDFKNEEDMSRYKILSLDESHPNMLSPDISKNEIEVVRKSWIDLHQRIGNYLENNDFDWGSNDAKIIIWHKFYFEPTGKIKAYFFRIVNNSVTESKRAEYEQLIIAFAKVEKIDFKKEFQFAQCGKTNYMN